jgi:hypothetical protein
MNCLLKNTNGKRANFRGTSDGRTREDADLQNCHPDMHQAISASSRVLALLCLALPCLALPCFAGLVDSIKSRATKPAVNTSQLK